MVNTLSNFDKPLPSGLSEEGLTCFTSIKFSSLGIPNVANNALGSRDVVFPSIDASVSGRDLGKLYVQREEHFLPVTPVKSTIFSGSLDTKSRF